MTGSPLPRRKKGYIWSREPMPAMIMAAWTTALASEAGTFTTPVTIRIGAIFATNMARTCWRPKGTALRTDIFPSAS